MLNFDSWVFANKSSDEFGLMQCTFDKPSGAETNGSVSSVKFNLTSNLVNGKWHKNGNSVYEEQPEFEITAMFLDGRNFDSYDIDAISRWLIREDKFEDFAIVKDDRTDLHIEVQIPKVEGMIVNGEIVGIKFPIILNSPFGFGHKVKFTSDTKDSSTLRLIDMSDRVGYIYPDITINVRSGGNVKIVNSIDPDNYFEIKNCKSGEVITVDGKTLQLKSSDANHKIYADWNYKNVKVMNTYDSRINIYTLDFDGSLTMKYSPIRKVSV